MDYDVGRFTVDQLSGDRREIEDSIIGCLLRVRCLDLVGEEAGEV